MQDGGILFIWIENGKHEFYYFTVQDFFELHEKINWGVTVVFLEPTELKYAYVYMWCV